MSPPAGSASSPPRRITPPGAIRYPSNPSDTGKPLAFGFRPRANAEYAMSPAAARSGVQLLVIAEDSHLVEGNAARRGEIGGDARARHHAIVQRDGERAALFQSLHHLGKCVAQAFDDLEHRQVRIRHAASGEV